MSAGRDIAAAALCAAALGGVLHPSMTADAASERVRIEVTGRIVPACSSATSTTTLNIGDPSKAGSTSYSFTVDCNAPFKYTMQSDNGALRLVGAPAAAARASVEVPYKVHINIPLTFGGAIDDTCASAAIKQGATSCHFSDSGRKVAIEKKASAEISWNGAPGQLAAGQYNDRLTVTVSVQL
jgi:hypothetical protein